MRSAMRAASQLPRGEPTHVDDAPAVNLNADDDEEDNSSNEHPQHKLLWRDKQNYLQLCTLPY